MLIFSSYQYNNNYITLPEIFYSIEMAKVFESVNDVTRIGNCVTTTCGQE
jgi:hypothetical protein